jgi:hypothetical protein
MMFWQEVQILFWGSADGSGLLRNVDGTFTFSESRRQFCSIKGNFWQNIQTYKRRILNSNGGTWRLCGATMATVAEHGFGPLYLTCGESGEESLV